MKFLLLIVSIFILAIVCTPVLAISASDLISSHRTGSSSAITIPTRFPFTIPTTIPTPHLTSTPTATPTIRTTIAPLPTRDFAREFFDIFSNRTPFTIPTIGPRMTPVPVRPQSTSRVCPPNIPTGALSHCLCSCVCFEGMDCSDCVDPETGWSYPMGMDKYGKTWIVKPGCPAIWGD